MARAGMVGLLGAALALGGCDDEQPAASRGAPPPPPPKPATCAGGGGTLADEEAKALFPRESGSFCLDPNGGDKAFGEKAELPLDRICDLFDGECEIYKGFNVRRVVQLRYVDGGGTSATIDINLSKYATSEDAYGMFTKRTVGDGDPADEATPRAVEGGGAAALGIGNAYLWRGVYLTEITYNDEAAAEPQIRAVGDKVLPPLVKAIGDKLPGDLALPTTVRRLPTVGLLPMGRRLVQKDVLGVEGVGPGAFGYYQEDTKRWRVVSMMRADADQAKDVLKTLLRVEGATTEKGLGDGAVRLTVGDGVPTEWVVARRGPELLGVGDEPRVLRSGMTPDEHAQRTLTQAEKMETLKAALDEPPPSP